MLAEARAIDLVFFPISNPAPRLQNVSRAFAQALDGEICIRLWTDLNTGKRKSGAKGLLRGGPDEILNAQSVNVSNQSDLVMDFFAL
jgi:hypothetical protein